MTDCPECGENVPEESNFCTACGAALEENASDEETPDRQTSADDTSEEETSEEDIAHAKTALKSEGLSPVDPDAEEPTDETGGDDSSSPESSSRNPADISSEAATEEGGSAGDVSTKTEKLSPVSDPELEETAQRPSLEAGTTEDEESDDESGEASEDKLRIGPNDLDTEEQEAVKTEALSPVQGPPDEPSQPEPSPRPAGDGQPPGQGTSANASPGSAGGADASAVAEGDPAADYSSSRDKAGKDRFSSRDDEGDGGPTSRPLVEYISRKFPTGGETADIWFFFVPVLVFVGAFYIPFDGLPLSQPTVQIVAFVVALGRVILR